MSAKDVIATREEIARYWYERGKELRDNPLFGWIYHLTIDLGEPSCWGCGSWNCENDICGWKVDEALKNFNNVEWLERCHIVPRSLGGSNKPENLVLMCHQCNIANPHTDNPEVFFGWMCNRPEEVRKETTENFQKILNVLDIKIEDISKGIDGLYILKSDAPDFVKDMLFANLCAHELITGDTQELASEIYSNTRKYFAKNTNISSKFGAIYNSVHKRGYWKYVREFLNAFPEWLIEGRNYELAG